MPVYDEKDYTSEIGRVELPGSGDNPAVFDFNGINSTLTIINIGADSYGCYVPTHTTSGTQAVKKTDVVLLAEAKAKLDNASGTPPLQYFDIDSTDTVYFDNVPKYFGVAIRAQGQSSVTASGGGIQFSFGETIYKFSG